MEKDPKKARYFLEMAKSCSKHIKTLEKSSYPSNVFFEIPQTETLPIFLYALEIREEKPKEASKYLLDLVVSARIPKSVKGCILNVIKNNATQEEIDKAIADFKEYLMFNYINRSYSYEKFLAPDDYEQAMTFLARNPEFLTLQDDIAIKEGKFLPKEEEQDKNLNSTEEKTETDLDNIDNIDNDKNDAVIATEELSDTLRSANNDFEEAKTTSKTDNLKL